jgi:hypothetical protein
VATQVSEIARTVVANLGLDSGYELSAQWVSQAYRELTARAKFRHLRQFGELYLAAPIQTGTCAITIDSPSVQLDATALLACQLDQFLGWPDGFAGLWFRPQTATVWYRIAEASASGLITLETPLAQDNNWLFLSGNTQGGLPFFITQRYLQLNPKARQLGVFICDFMYRPLSIVSEDELNTFWSNRPWVWNYPQWVAELNSNKNATGYPKQVELAPWPLQSCTLHYTYWETPQGLGWDDFVPPTIDPDILRSGASVQACSNASGKAIRMGKLEEAAFWLNRSNQFKTEFEGKVSRAIRNDRGAEDLAFKLQRHGWRPPLDWDPITSAFDQFIARGY